MCFESRLPVVHVHTYPVVNVSPSFQFFYALFLWTVFCLFHNRLPFPYLLTITILILVYSIIIFFLHAPLIHSGFVVTSLSERIPFPLTAVDFLFILFFLLSIYYYSDNEERSVIGGMLSGLLYSPCIAFSRLLSFLFLCSTSACPAYPALVADAAVPQRGRPTLRLRVLLACTTTTLSWLNARAGFRPMNANCV